MRADEHGFSVAEAAIGLGLVALLFVTLGFGMAGGMRTLLRARFIEQATALATTSVENARGVGYDVLEMKTSDLTGDTNVLPGNRFDPDGSGPLASEPLASSTAGGDITPHKTTETIDGSTFDVAKYVTWVDAATQGGASRDLKRLTVLLTKKSGSSTQTHRVSTLITDAKRGMPVPKFELTPDTQSKSVQQNNTVVFAHSVRNLGITDTFDLLATIPPTRSWTVSFYKDNGAVGEYESSLDTLLTDTNSTGVVDTGSTVTDQVVNVLAVWTLSPTETTGTANITVTARSGADSSITHDSTDTLTVTAATNDINLFLQNKPNPPTGDTTAQKDMLMGTSSPTATTLYKYSTNYSTSHPGRWIDKKNTTHSESDSKFMANWVYQVPETTTYNGTAELKIWVAQSGLKCDKTPNVQIYLREKSSAGTNSGTQFVSTSVSSPPSGSEPCNLRLVTHTFSVNRTVNRNQWIELKVAANDSSGDPVLFGYATTTYDAKLKMPRVTT